MKDRIEKSLSILKETAIAGLKFCIIANSKFEKIFWILIGILGIAGMSVLFFIQIQSWNMNPIVSTRKWIDLSEVELPAITFCHHGNTRTEIADRLIQAADEKSPKIRQLRSLIMKHSLEFMIDDEKNQFKKFSSDISEHYNLVCNSSSTGNQCEDCICKNFGFGFAYGKENNLTMEQVYEKIFVDLREEDDISIGLTMIGAEIGKINENYNISETLDSKDFQWTFLEKIDAILRIVPKIPTKMPMDFSKSILPLIASNSLITKENMDELFSFFELPNNEVNLMAISHLFTITDFGQLGKSNSFSFWDNKEQYLGGVPKTFQKCFKEIYEELHKPEEEKYNEIAPIEQPIPLTPSPCSNISENHPCHDYCQWHKSLINRETLTSQEFFALMKLSQPQRKVLMDPMSDAEWNLTMKVFGDTNPEAKRKAEHLQDFASMPFVIFCKDRVDQKWHGDDIGMTPKFCSDFYPTPTNQGLCMTKNLKYEDLIDFSSDFKESFKGNKEGNPVFVEGGRLKSKATFVLYTNAGSVYGYPGYGIKTFSKFKTLDKAGRMRDMSKVDFQIHSPREIPQILKRFEFDEDLRSLTLDSNYEYTIDVVPASQKITDDAKKINYEERGCLLASEIPTKSVLKIYNEQNCRYECNINYAMEKCSCLSWDFSLNNKNGMQECDVFGRSCFSRAMQQFSRVEKDMCPHCGQACEYTNYHKTMDLDAMGFTDDFFDWSGTIKNPCSPKDICEYLLHSNGTIDSTNVWMQELFGTKTDSSDQMKFKEFIMDHIIVHIKFASSKIDIHEIDVRYTFYDRLAKLGGALGLCCQMTGASLLTMIHLLVLIIKATWNCFTARA